MSNIWEVSLQTASVTLVAALLLIVKRLFDDKLSPRWQYGIWSILAIRILGPAVTSRNVLLPLPLLFEGWKSEAEAGLASAYTNIYQPLSPEHVLPVLQGNAVSITDWLMVIYVFGVFCYLFHYVLSYVRLRLLLRKRTPAPEETVERIASVCIQYGLKSCRIIMVDGLSSAFICGVFRPVLALPAKKETDDFILLHELLHLKHYDALQSILWCILHSLHWCNPFLYPVFRIIENDMEALCDQRVLERLEGEDRRLYGQLLLSMANDTYARSVGTTSISNGGKNISKRITAIVRFKKYPKGMALVSVCAALVLAGPCILGSAATYDADTFEPSAKKELVQAMAMSRLNRCTTIAGALDTYAKGTFLSNGVYLACAAPLERQEELFSSMMQQQTASGEFKNPFYYAADNSMTYADWSQNYQIFNICETSAGVYEALLVLPVSRHLTEDGNDYLYDENGDISHDCYVIIPVRLWKEENSWVVEETGARIRSSKHFFDTYYFPEFSDIPWIAETTATGTTGTVTVASRVLYQIDNTVQATANGLSFWSSSASFDNSPKTDAEFQFIKLASYITYDCSNNAIGKLPQRMAGIRIIETDSSETHREIEWPETAMMTGTVSGTSNQGYSWTNREFKEGWDYIVQDISTSYYAKEDPATAFPDSYCIEAFWDGKLVEEFIIKWEDTSWNNTKLYVGQ